MALTINCPHCQAKVRAPETLIGKKVKCPTCKEQFTVDADAAESPAAAPPPEPLTFKQEAYTESKPTPPDDADDDDDDDADQEEVKRPKKKARASGGGFADFLLFRTMITPFAVQVVYFLATAAVILFGLAQMAFGLIGVISSGSMTPLLLIPLGLLYMVIGVVLVRIYCEILILFFRMYDVAKEIKEELEKRR